MYHFVIFPAHRDVCDGNRSSLSGLHTLQFKSIGASVNRGLLLNESVFSAVAMSLALAECAIDAFFDFPYGAGTL